MQDRKNRTLNSLAGLSVGDAFGECFFRLPHNMIKERKLPPAPWPWTDDTHMAISVVETLLEHGKINEEVLVQLFVKRYRDDPWRGYGSGAGSLLEKLVSGKDWKIEAPRLFNGGSFGNGGAMRAAPVGAFFAEDPERAAGEAKKAASVTHAHPEGQAGAMAVAAAAAVKTSETDTPLFEAVLSVTPVSRTRDAIERASQIQGNQHQRAIGQLGTGAQVAAFDTVPYCLWIVSHFGRNFEEALWKTVEGLGDRDTTCAIVGGIIGGSVPIPDEWINCREPLPEKFSQ